MRSGRRGRRGGATLRRRMSGRGRATLLAIALMVTFALGYGASGVVTEGLARLHSSASGVGLLRRGESAFAVSSGAQPSLTGPVALSPPSEILARLPVAVQDYDSTLSVVDGLDPAAPPRWVESVSLRGGGGPLVGPLQVEYSFDAELTRRILEVLDRGRVGRGHVIVLDPSSGRLLAYVSTDVGAFPPDRSYPAASLVKVVTAAAALSGSPEEASRPCVYRGNQYRLTRSRVYRPKSGNRVTLGRALATSNNQCFAQLAVNTVGSEALLAAIENFGWLEGPAPGHPAGSIDPGKSDYDLARLGCGLSGCRITPLHAAQLAAILARGERVTPWWIDRVLDARGMELALPSRPPPRRVMSEALAGELRSMLVRTTTRGTARGAFRDRRGRARLGGIQVAGKTGNLTGTDPAGRYEWFIGVAPAGEPSIAVAVLQLQGNLWWSKSSQIAADVLVQIFCRRGRCEPGLAARFTGDLGTTVSPVLLSDSSARRR